MPKFSDKFLKIYNVIMGGTFPLFLIHYGTNRLLGHKYKHSAVYRLGLKIPVFEKTASDPVWIHALSVGETMASVPLVSAILEKYPATRIIFSTSTEAGQETAGKKFEGKVSRVFYLPHDFSWAIERLVSGARPRLFIAIETDAWPNLLYCLRKYNVPAFLVNGRMSPRSFGRYYRVRRLSRYLFESFEMCLMQSSDDMDKLLELGVSEHKVKNTGNLKFDIMTDITEDERNRLIQELVVGDGTKVLVAGSTHGGEEKIIMNVFSELVTEIPGLRLVLVPRHPVRATEVESLVNRKGLKCSFRSLGGNFGNADVVVVDTMGELAKLYSVATVAFIGGSLVPVGGHNPLEALSFGVPVIFGPHMFNFREIESKLLGSGCAVKVWTRRELKITLKKLLENPELLKRMRSSAKEVVKENRGTAGRVMTFIDPYLRREANV